MYLLKFFAADHSDNSLFSAFFLTKTFISVASLPREERPRLRSPSTGYFVFFSNFFEKTALGKYFEVTAALGKYFEALPFSNFLKEMVSGSKLKCPSKVSWEVSFSLYYSVIYGNCLGNVVVGMEKCGKM